MADTERLVRGVISSDWAEHLAEQPQDIDDFNGPYKKRDGRDWDEYRTAAELRELAFDEIGGLVILCTEELYTPLDIAENLSLRAMSRFINLALQEPARLTSTAYLAAGALERLNHLYLDSSTPLLPLDKLVRDGNDTWAIPESAIELVGSDVVVTNRQLPHKIVI